MFNLFKREKHTKARILDKDSFNEYILINKQPALVTFSAAWCGACKMQKPLIHDIAHHHRDTNMVIGFIDVDNQRELVKRFAISSMPTTILFKEAEIIFKKSGILSRGDLEKLIKELL